MLTMNDLNPLLRRRSTVITGEGEKVGTVGVVYLNDVDEQPTWVTVHTGLFGSRESFVPLEGASVEGHDLVVAYPRELVRHAPSVDRDGDLSPEEEAALYRHYGIRAVAPPRATRTAEGDTVAASSAPSSGASAAGPSVDSSASAASPAPHTSAAHSVTSPTTSSSASSLTSPAAASSLVSAHESTSTSAAALMPEESNAGQAAGASASSAPVADQETVDTARSVAAPMTDDVADAPSQSGVHTHDDGGTPWVVRSEERLRVGTEQYEAGRVRLRKYVVTEEETVSVPLLTEEVRVVVEPITSATAVDLGSAFQEESVELVAREEVAVVGKETVAVERVRMSTVEVTGRATVRDSVRKERISIAVDGDAATDAGGSDRTPAKRTRSAKASSKTQPKVQPDGPVKSGNALVKGKKKRR